MNDPNLSILSSFLTNRIWKNLPSNQQELIKELWENCGEYLEIAPEILWAELMTPVLIRLLDQEREKSKHIQKLLDIEIRKKHEAMNA